MRTQKIKNNHKFTLITGRNIFNIARERMRAQAYGATVIIPHVCNNINVFGAGFASDVAQQFPIVQINFHMLGNKARLGHTQFVEAEKDDAYKHQIIFANMIAQNKTISGSNPRPLNYEALTMCMREVRSFIHNIKERVSDNRVEIHCPRFGSGLAGGDWNLISYLIDDIWSNIPVFVYNFNRTINK